MAGPALGSAFLGAAVNLGTTLYNNEKGFSARHEQAYDNQTALTQRLVEGLTKSHKEGDLDDEDHETSIRLRDEAIEAANDYGKIILDYKQVPTYNIPGKLKMRAQVRKTKRKVRQVNEQLQTHYCSSMSGSDSTSVTAQSGSPPGSGLENEMIRDWTYNVHSNRSRASVDGDDSWTSSDSEDSEPLCPVSRQGTNASSDDFGDSNSNNLPMKQANSALMHKPKANRKPFRSTPEVFASASPSTSSFDQHRRQKSHHIPSSNSRMSTLFDAPSSPGPTHHPSHPAHPTPGLTSPIRATGSRHFDEHGHSSANASFDITHSLSPSPSASMSVVSGLRLSSAVNVNIGIPLVEGGPRCAEEGLPSQSSCSVGGGMATMGAISKPMATNNFVTKLYQMISDSKSGQFISWTELGTSFVVSNVGEFSRSILGSHFKHNNFSSFVRQLNMYGFHKINRTPRAQRTSTDAQTWEFSHHKFLRGRPDLLDEIKRRALLPDPIKHRTELPSEPSQLSMMKDEVRRCTGELALERRKVDWLTKALCQSVGKALSVPPISFDLLDASESPNIYMTSPSSSSTSWFAPPPLSMNGMNLHTIHGVSSTNEFPFSHPYHVSHHGHANGGHGAHPLSRRHSFHHQNGIAISGQAVRSSTPIASSPSPGSLSMDMGGVGLAQTSASKRQVKRCSQ